MKKRVLIWGITGSLIAIAVTIVLLLTGQSETHLGVAKVDKITEGKSIAVNSRAESFGVLKGDVFLYYVDILYDPSKISEIDTKGLIDTVDLTPFDVRTVSETEFKLNDGTKVQRLAYELQLVDGTVNKLYNFSSIVVRYKLSGSEGFQEMPASAEPVYVSSRLPESDEDFVELSYIDLGYEAPLRALKGEILEVKQNSIPWILLAAGSLLAIGTAIDFTTRVMPQKRRDKENSRIEKNKQIARIYNTIYKNIDNGASCNNIIYQIDHIARFVIFRNEHLDWLEELDINQVSADIREDASAVFNNVAKIGKGTLKDSDVKDSLKYMDKILKYYYHEDVDTWKN